MYVAAEMVSLRPVGLRAGRRIPSDPELENQINDRMCGRARLHILAGGKPAPEGWPGTG
jgi:hypothetical protein